MKQFASSFTSVNKRIPANLPQYENLSFYQAMICTPRFNFSLNMQYEAKATIVMAMDSETDVLLKTANTSWIDIKEILLKHFMVEEYQELQSVKQHLVELQLSKEGLQKNFENCFLAANQDTL